MKNLLLLALFIPFYLSSYEFKNGCFDVYNGYRREDISIRHPKSDITANYIEEKLKNYNLYELRIKSDYQFDDGWYLGGYFSYQTGNSHDLKTSWRVEALNSNSSFSATTLGTFYNSGDLNAIDIFLDLGYQARLGPIYLRPVLGVFYNLNLLNRDHLRLINRTALDQGVAVSYLFYPKKDLSLQWAMAMIGLDLQYTPVIFGRIRYEAGYHFFLGKTFEKANYHSLTTILQNIRDLDYKVNTSALSLGHQFYLSGTYGFLDWLSGKIEFTYQYFHAHHGKATYEISGTQNASGSASSVSDKFSNDLDHITQQSFLIGAVITFQY